MNALSDMWSRFQHLGMWRGCWLLVVAVVAAASLTPPSPHDSIRWKWREMSAASVTGLSVNPRHFHRESHAWPASPATVTMPVVLGNGSTAVVAFQLPRASWDCLRSVALCVCGGEASALPLLTALPAAATAMCASDARRACRDHVSTMWRSLLHEHERSDVLSIVLGEARVPFRRGDDVFALVSAVAHAAGVLPPRNFTDTALRAERRRARNAPSGGEPGGGDDDAVSDDGHGGVVDAANATAIAARVGLELAALVVDLVQDTQALPQWAYLWNREPAPFPFPFQASHYLHLLRNAVTGATMRDENMAPFMPRDYDWSTRLVGRDWPAHAHTMVGLARTVNTHFALADTVASGVAGDFFEAGVWRGGTCIFAHAFYSELGASDRVVWLADSFAGLPPPKPQEFPADANDHHHTLGEYLAVSEADVAANFALYGFTVAPGASDGPVRFVKGFFSDSLPTLPLRRVSVVRVDGDMYESTWVTLQTMFLRLSVGGYVICDDVGLPGSRLAVVDYRYLLGLSTDVDPLVPIDVDGAYWRRGPGPVLLGSSVARFPLHLQLLSLPCVRAPVALVHSDDDHAVLEASLHRAVSGMHTVRFTAPSSAASAAAWLRDAGVTANATVEPRSLHVSCRSTVPSRVLSSPSVPVHVAAALLDVEAVDVLYLHPVVFVDDDASEVAADGSVSLAQRSVCDRAGDSSPSTTLPVCQLLTRFDDPAAALAATPSSLFSSGVDVSLLPPTLRTLRELQVLGFDLAFVDAASGVALLVNAAFCDPLALRVATELPARHAATGDSEPAEPVPTLRWDPVVTPALLARLQRGDAHALREVTIPAYTTGVVVTVAGTLRFNVARRAVDNAYHFARRGVVVAVVARGRHDAGLLNLRLLFPALVWVASDEHEPLAAAWNRAVEQLRRIRTPDVLLFVSDDARLDYSVVSLTDAAAATAGPHAPMTNAPKRGQTRSPMFAVRGTWQAECEATPVVCDGGASSVTSLPLSPDTLSLHSVNSRAFAASFGTLRQAALPPVTADASPSSSLTTPQYFDASVPSFDVDVAWTRQWMAASGEASPVTRLVRSAFVWHTSVSDAGDADAAFGGDHELCGVDSSPFPYALWP